MVVTYISFYGGVSNAAQAGRQLGELSLSAGLGDRQTCNVSEDAFKGLEGKLERLRIHTGKVRRGTA
jgi:hypothetical protein